MKTLNFIFLVTLLLFTTCLTTQAQTVPESTKKSAGPSGLLLAPSEMIIVHRCYQAPPKPVPTGDPLIVVDNIPYVGSLKDLNLQPSQIKYIHILKDAAAVVLWGEKAGNGVILIGTKKNDSVKLTSKHPAKARAVKSEANHRPIAMLISSNPAKDRFSLKLLKSFGAFHVSLVNMQGQVLRTWAKANASIQRYEFDITGIPPGVYVAIIEMTGQKQAIKILVDQN